jgi:hypothetical protein
VVAVAVIKQLNKKNIRQQLALATGALLTHEAHASESDEIKLYSPWEVDVGYLRYTEPDYITVDTVMAMLNGNVSDKDTVKIGLVFDTLTGSTPTGEIPDSDIVSVSGVSGGSVSADGGSGGNALFDDTRLAFDANWGHEWQRLIRSNVNAYVSVEGDYTAIGGSIGIEKDNNDKSTTYSAAYGMSTDTVSRSDESTPEPLSDTSKNIMYGAGQRNSYEALFGLSHVINRRTVGQLNLTYSRSLGYHTDPYKMISIADSSDGTNGTVFESRQDNRERYIIYSKIAHELPKSGHHIDASYRLHIDNWGVNSHTFEGGYSFTKNNKHLFKPFGRIYHQEAADFYTRSIPYSGDPNINTSDIIESIEGTYASSDVRLSEMTALTAGVKYQFKLSSRSAIDLRVAYIHRDYRDAVINEDGSYFVTLGLGSGFD